MKHIEVAITQLGVEESPRNSNWGDDVKKYLNSVGIDFPASWCMAFVYWCVKESGIVVPLETGGFTIPLKKTGGVLRQWNEVAKHRKFAEPKAGDIFIMDLGKGLGHTGFVESIEESTGLLHTIEGNTNDSGSREGYEVFRRLRKISAMKGFIRLP